MDFKVKRKNLKVLNPQPKLFTKVIFCTNTLYPSIEIYRHTYISIYRDTDTDI